MSIKGIDVSAHQGSIDWQKVAAYGMGFAILRITEKGNKTDSTFEANYSGCKKYNIPVGVYKYSYAKTAAEAKTEAQYVVAALSGKKIDYPVFYDLEWSTQRQLGSTAIEKIALAFLTHVKQAGYKVGIYCNTDWYQNVLTDTLRSYDCWVARYPANDNGEMQERLKPSFGIGWQYSSKATIPGINTTVDRSIFWKDYKDSSSTNSSNTGSTTSGGGTITSSSTHINNMIKIATAEIGYLEKRSLSNLDDKTANAGSNNITRYWRDIKPDYQGQPWCACFVTWVFVQAFGKDAAKKLLKHYPYVYCPTMASLFTLNANPKVGDIVIFKHNGTFTHTGIVVGVDGDKFTTIEGNTSGGSTIVANGGGVCKKSYYNSNLPGTKFCTPDYSIVKYSNSSATTSSTSENTSSNTGGTTTSSVLQKGNTGSAVKTMQTMLIACGYSCGSSGADGDFGSGTETALKKFQKENGLTADGQYGSKSKAKLEAVYKSKTSTRSPSKTPKFVGKVSGCNKLNVRKGAGTEYDKLSSYPTLAKGNLVDVCDTIYTSDGTWYYIRIASKYFGYVSAKYIARQ